MLGTFHQSPEPALQNATVTRPGEIILDRGSQLWATGKRQHPFSLGYCFLLLAHLGVNLLEDPARRRKLGIDVEYLVKLVDGLVVVMGKIELAADRGINDQ